MAKLRHLALSVKDLEASAKFYEDAFGMERVRQSKVAIMLSDGVVSLALLHLRSNDNAPDERGPDYIGLHHMGFLVDDVPTASAAVEGAGGTYHGQILNVGKGPESERKYRDPNGIVIDVTSKEHADSSWRVPTDT
ncbi:MAG: VOC family protein [Proteobacteria bacterium]|nr:VOC family protein [Pseudomonadota bacterium]